jgi:hypothetical protein
MSLNNRLDRLAKLLPEPVRPDAWLYYAEQAKVLIAKVAMLAAECSADRHHRHAGRGRGGNLESIARTTTTGGAEPDEYIPIEAMTARLDREGLLKGPLDDEQLRRLQAIDAEIIPDAGEPTCR